MNRNYYELTTRFDARKSFYGKALVEVEEVEKQGTVYTNKTLISYGHEVVRITASENKIRLTTSWNASDTTLRHVKEFLKQEVSFEVGNKSKKELEEYFKDKIEEE